MAGTAQAVHDDPQLAVLLFAAQALPHTWKPLLQENPHDVPSHVAVPAVGGEQGVQAAPQSLTLVFD